MTNSPASPPTEELKCRNTRALRVLFAFLAMLGILALLAAFSYGAAWLHFHYNPMPHAPHRADWPWQK